MKDTKDELKDHKAVLTDRVPLTEAQVDRLLAALRLAADTLHRIQADVWAHGWPISMAYEVRAVDDALQSVPHSIPFLCTGGKEWVLDCNCHVRTATHTTATVRPMQHAETCPMTTGVPKLSREAKPDSGSNP